MPKGEIWASKSSAHRWLLRWQTDGTSVRLQARILGIASERGLINWNYGAVDGSFSPGKGGGDSVACGYSITVVDLRVRAFAVVMISSNGLMHSAPVRPVQDKFK